MPFKDYQKYVDVHSRFKYQHHSSHFNLISVVNSPNLLFLDAFNSGNCYLFSTNSSKFTKLKTKIPNSKTNKDSSNSPVSEL